MHHHRVPMSDSKLINECLDSGKVECVIASKERKQFRRNSNCQYVPYTGKKWREEIDQSDSRHKQTLEFSFVTSVSPGTTCNSPQHSCSRSHRVSESVREGGGSSGGEKNSRVQITSRKKGSVVGDEQFLNNDPEVI